MKQKFIDAYMDTAFRFSKLSSAVRRKVGAIAVKDERIISIGYNGTPSGWSNECEDIEYVDMTGKEDYVAMTEAGWVFGADSTTAGWTRRITKPEVLHAEMNCLMKLAKFGESGNGATMFITDSPCMDCAKGIFQAGISNVFYKNEYRSTDGISFLQKCGVTVTRV